MIVVDSQAASAQSSRPASHAFTARSYALVNGSISPKFNIS